MDYEELLKLAKEDKTLNDKKVGYLAIESNKVYGKNDIPGLFVKTKEKKDGVDIKIIIKEKVKIKRPIHLCFGVTSQKELQKIKMDITLEKEASASVLAHCLFPNSIDVKHIMKAKIRIKENASFTYKEEHFHGYEKGANIDLKADIYLDKKSKFKNIFKLAKGSVGKLKTDYKTINQDESVSEIITKVSGSGNDLIKIKEESNLLGEKAKSLLISKIAVREKAKAEVYNVMTAKGENSRGHIDCKEIIQNEAEATAIPIVKVLNSTARITHEAAIGSIDEKQIETLMSRGVDKEKAIQAIINGIIS